MAHGIETYVIYRHFASATYRIEMSICLLASALSTHCQQKNPFLRSISIHLYRFIIQFVFASTERTVDCELVGDYKRFNYKDKLSPTPMKFSEKFSNILECFE